MTDDQQLERVLYLLHFAPPYKGAMHYLGITKASTIGRRLEDHRRGKGAGITRRALESGSTLTLVRLWHHATPQDERRVKYNGHFNKLCPLCLHRLPTEECRAYPPLVQRVASSPSTPIVNW